MIQLAGTKADTRSARVSRSQSALPRPVTEGTPYGASCVTGVGAELRMPTALELEMCRFQGEHATGIAAKLAAA